MSYYTDTNEGAMMVVLFPIFHYATYYYYFLSLYYLHLFLPWMPPSYNIASFEHCILIVHSSTTPETCRGYVGKRSNLCAPCTKRSRRRTGNGGIGLKNIKLLKKMQRQNESLRRKVNFSFPYQCGNVT